MVAQAKSSARQPPEFLVVGRVLRPHGIRGGLVVEAASEIIRSLEHDSEIFLGQGGRPEKVLSIRPHRKRYLLYLEGCLDRDAAERFRGMEIRVPMQASAPLPEGVYYRWQILGLAVETEGGKPLGEVTDILSTGANDVYVVRGESQGEILLPAIESVIKQVDLTSGRMIVHPLPGLLPEK